MEFLNNKQANLIIILSVIFYLSLAIYGLFYNFTWIDESKYLVKGYLMASGKVSLYNTPSFPYQHMPLSMLWFGLGQLLTGPSLLVGRLQGMLAGLAVLFLSYKLSSILKDKTAGLITLLIFCFSFNTILHYSTATPEALIAFLFILAFLSLYKALVKNSALFFLLTSFLFTLLFLVRENFLPTLLFYYGFIAIILYKKPFSFLLNLLVSFILLFIVLYPTYPGIIKVLANFPGFSLILTTVSERHVLNIHWYTIDFSNQLKLSALYKLMRTYQLFFYLVFVISIFYLSSWKSTSQRLKKMFENNRKRLFIIYFAFMITVILLNFFVHLFVAFKLSPRSIISYFDYFYPLCTIIIGILLTNVWKLISIFRYKFLFFVLSCAIIFFSFNSTSIPLFQFPTNKPALIQIIQNSQSLSKSIKPGEKVFLLGEMIPLYLAKRDTYWPLYNGLNLFKPGAETNIVKEYGFWNEELAKQWLAKSNLVVMEKSKWQTIEEEKPLQNLKKVFTEQLQNYRLKTTIDNYYGNDTLLIYEKIKDLN